MQFPEPFPDLIGADLHARFSPGERLSFTVPMTADGMDWWKERLGDRGLYPRELCARLFGHLPFDMSYVIDPPDLVKGHVRIEARAHNDLGGRVLSSGRAIEFDNDQIHLSKTLVEVGFRRNSYGAILLRNAFLLAQELNLSKLALTAIDHGSYVWAKAGFLPDPESWAEGRTQTAISDKIKRMHDPEDGSKPVIDRSLRNRLLAFVNTDDIKRLRAISLLPGEVPSTHVPGTKVKTGWAMLVESGATWKGELRLGDDDATEILRSYLRERGLSS